LPLCGQNQEAGAEAPPSGVVTRWFVMIHYCTLGHRKEPHLLRRSAETGLVPTVCQSFVSLAAPHQEKAKRERNRESNIPSAFFGLIFFNAGHFDVSSLKEYSSNAVTYTCVCTARGTSPEVAHNCRLFHSYAYPSGNSHKPWFRPSQADSRTESAAACWLADSLHVFTLYDMYKCTHQERQPA
jgi:hypothetical protein